MKLIRFPLALALCCCLLLSGCAGGAPTASQSAETSSASSASSSSGGLTEEDVLAAYREAAEVYDWFDLCPMPVSGETVTFGDYSYQPSAQADITTYAQLKARLTSLFSDEIVEKLLGGTPPLYRDINGRLYVLEAARGSDINLLDKTVAAAQGDADHWTVTLTFYADSYDIDPSAAVIGWSKETLNYENTAAGWRFTSFCPSDGLNEDADTVFTFNYQDDAAFSRGDYQTWSPLKLACWLLHADGAYAGGPAVRLAELFSQDPNGVVSDLSVFPGSPWKYAGTVLDLIGEAGAEGTQFQSALASCKPENPQEQAVLEAISAAAEAGGKADAAGNAAPQQ